jgi:small conductance mechanosensitive channel
LLENQVRKGDVASVNGTGGLVESVGLRTLLLRDMTGTLHVFQNGKIGSLSNLTKDWSAAVFEVGIEYRQDTDEAAALMKQVGEELKEDEIFGSKILEPIEIFGVDRFDDSAVILKARIKTKPIEQWNVSREYNRRLKKLFDAHGVTIPFPQQTLSFDADTPVLVDALKKAG